MKKLTFEHLKKLEEIGLFDVMKHVDTLAVSYLIDEKYEFYLEKEIYICNELNIYVEKNVLENYENWKELMKRKELKKYIDEVCKKF